MAENTYIEANSELVEQAKNKLRKEHLPVDIDTFVTLFNTSVINTRNQDIKDIVKLLTGGYANVASQSNRIYVKSKAETLIEQSQFILKQYSLAAALKRIAQGLLDADYPDNTKMIFKKENPGAIYLEPESEDGVNSLEPKDFKDLELYDGAERFTGSKTALPNNLFLKKLLFDYKKEEHTAFMITSKVAQLSVDPVMTLQSFINDSTNIIKNINN